MSKIIRAALVFILILVVQGLIGYSFLSGLFNIAALVSFLYLLYVTVSYLRLNPGTNKKKENPPVGSTDAGKFWVPAIIVILFFIYFGREFLGRISFAFFLSADNMVKLSPSLSPVLMWGFLGLFAGLIYGSVVAWKKYRLNFLLNLIPVGLFLGIVILLVMVNEPSAGNRDSQIAPATVERIPDTIDAGDVKKYIVNRWIVEDVSGSGRENFLERKKSVTSELEFQKSGKCFLKENGIRKALLYYTLAPDGRTILFSNPNNSSERRQIQIIAITKNSFVIKSELFQNDTAVLKAK